MLKIEEYAEIINKCSHCGYCQAACPVYREELMESYVARSRINLIKSIFLDKSAPITPRAREIINRCLLCTNCTQTCTSGLPCDEIITAARIELAAQSKGMGNAAKRMALSLFNQRGLAGFLGKIGSAAQKLNLAPKDLPPLASRSFDSQYKGKIPAQGELKGRLAYFVGCGTNFMYPDTGKSVVQVLTANGYEVIIPAGMTCCGIPALAEGDIENALQAVRANITVLSALEVDGFITDCTSCAMAFKVKAAKILPPDDVLQERLSCIVDKFYEVTDFLKNNTLSGQPRELNLKYTYHVPCHRSWSATAANAPRIVLGSIPGLERVEMNEPESCCGAAGTFYLQHRDLSERIRSHKLDDIRDTGADIVVTQCPVCRFFLASQLREQRVMHPVGLLAHAMGISINS